MSMRCPRCQHENPVGQKFCGECGIRLTARCTACGAANPPAQKFCGECGASLGGVAPAEPGPGDPSMPHLASPERYTPKHLAEKILGSRAALLGERKQVTVLFADLKGSLELLADRDPEDARRLLDPVLTLMMEAVHRYEGTVNQVMGDGVMALFGAPVAHEDHALRACYAALAMQEAVRRYADALHLAEGVPVQIRVGLNTGEVVVRSIGSDLRMDYTAVGQTTHLAARMEQMARPGSILITSDVLGLAEGYVEVASLGTRPVKGLAEPVTVYELTAARPVRSRLQATAARGLTRFVGRSVELEHLARALDLAGGGRGQLLAVVGEPGVGKSRLFWEFTHSHRTHGWLVLESVSVSYGRATAWLPVVDLLRTYFRIGGRDDARQVREKVTGKVLALDRALEPTLPALLWLLDAAPDDPGWGRLDPSRRRRLALESVKRLLLRESLVQPLVLIVEDLHWIDTETQAFLDDLVESLPTARVLLLVNYRPEYRHDWGGKTYYTQLRIDPLGGEGAEALLDGLLGLEPALAPLRRLLVRETEGNPLFLEESVRGLVETGVLAGERGQYRLARPLETIRVPATVQALIEARIDRLEPEDKTLLQAAAVIGKSVPQALLAATGSATEASLAPSLARLRAGEFLYESQLFPEPEYTFKHALTQQVAYESVLRERRRSLHREVGEAIERLYPDRLGELAETLAIHFERGEGWPSAARWALAAAARARDRYAYAAAGDLATRGLAAAARAPGLGEPRTDLLVLLGDLASLAGDLEGANRRYEEALGGVTAEPARRRITNRLHRPHTTARDGARIAFYEHGSGDDTLLLMNPIVYGLGMFQPMIERLGEGFRIITMDPRGTGASDPLPERFYTHADHAADVRAVIEAAGGRPVTGIGISRGGNILVRLAVEAPRLFRGVVLVGTPPGVPGADSPWIMRSEADARFRECLRQRDIPGAMRSFVTTVLTDPGTGDMAAEFVLAAGRLAPETILNFFSPDPEGDITLLAERVRVPTLVVQGSEDRRVTLASSRYLAEHIPGARLYLFEGRGHLPIFTATAEFCDVLCGFIRTGEPPRATPERA